MPSGIEAMVKLDGFRRSMRPMLVESNGHAARGMIWLARDSTFHPTSDAAASDSVQGSIDTN